MQLINSCNSIPIKLTMNNLISVCFLITILTQLGMAQRISYERSGGRQQAPAYGGQEEAPQRQRQGNQYGGQLREEPSVQSREYGGQLRKEPNVQSREYGGEPIVQKERGYGGGQQGPERPRYQEQVSSRPQSLYGRPSPQGYGQANGEGKARPEARSQGGQQKKGMAMMGGDWLAGQLLGISRWWENE